MSDRTAASAGFVLAGLALTAVLLPWPAVDLASAVLGILAVVAFGLRRHGYLDRRLGAPVAGGSGLALAGAAAAAVTTGTDPGAVGGLTLAAGTGLLSAVAAYADWHAIPRGRLIRMGSATASAAVVGVSGLIAIFAWGQAIGAVLRAVSPEALASSLAIPFSTVALGLGTGTVAAIYLAGRDRGLAFIDLRWPGRRDAAYVAAGVIAIVGLNVAIGLAFRWIGLDSARHAVVRQAESDPAILLVLIPLSYLIIGPGEELLYRNIVQKSLYDAFTRRGAVVVASVVFASIHLFAFADPDGGTLATLNTLVLVFVLSLVLGTVYVRTENVLVPALVHGSFDAIAFGVNYVELAGI